VKKTVAVAVAIVFVLALAAPVFASMDHDAQYKLDGTIEFEKQVGHICNTGAEMKQTIDGEGEITKVMDTAQVAGKITVSDQNDWITADDAVNNLTVTSVIELCAPGKSVYDGAADTVYDDMVIPPAAWYANEAGLAPDGILTVEGAQFAVSEIDELTDQIWAVQVEADPGFSGGLTQGFEAAYGPFAGAQDYWYGDWESEPDDAWWFVDEDGDPVLNPLDADDVDYGKDYVGNYFSIEQFARTSQGETKRYVDVSSPWSHGYAYEDSSVTGMAEIQDSFEMGNLPAGDDVVPDWWDLF